MHLHILIRSFPDGVFESGCFYDYKAASGFRSPPGRTPSMISCFFSDRRSISPQSISFEIAIAYAVPAYIPKKTR